jgi:hypothetical protein
MAHYNLPTDVYETYRASVHGNALLEKKDLSVATCVSCHGSHGAVPPGVKEIGETCGKCHINEKKFFLESVHAQPMVRGTFSECISCHGHHEVQHADKVLYEQTCLKCHDAASAAAQEGKRILRLLDQSEGELKSAEALVKQAGIEGIFVEEEEGSLEEAKTNVIAMAPLQHSLSYARVSELYNKFTEVARDIKAKIQNKRRSLKWRKAALIPVWIFILVMVSALWVKYNRLKFGKEDKKGK